MPPRGRPAVAPMMGTMKRTAGVALVAFAIGTGFGYWLAPAPEAPARARTARTGVAAPVPEPEQAAPARHVEGVPEPPAGDGTIRGRVLDEHAEPIANALVVAVPERPDAGGRHRRASEVPWQEVSLRAAAEGLRWYERHQRRTRTDTAGRYVLDHLGATPHGVRAYREGYQVRRAPDAPRGSVTPDATIDFTAKRFVLVAVEVVMPDGKLAEKARLQTERPGGTHWSDWRPDSPWAELQPGTYEIKATAGERQEYTSEKQTIRVDADVESPKVRLQLAGERGLRVRAKLPEGFTARWFHVEYVRFTGPEPPGLAVLRAGEHLRSRRSASSKDGDLWIPDLEPGRYLVGVHHGNYHFTAHAVVEVGDGITDLVLAIARPDPAECFTVRALRPDGSVERHVSVHVTILTDSGGHGGGGDMLCGPDGTHYCAYPAWDRSRYGELPENARYVATVGAGDLGRRTVEFEREPGAALEVRFAEPATLRVVIDDFAKSEHRDAFLISVFQTGTGPVAWWQAPTPEGTHEFDTLQPGPYRVVLHLAAGQLDRWPIATRDIDVTSGENELRVAIPRLYTLEVEVADPKPGLTVTLGGGEDPARFSVSRGVSADGLVRFLAIPAGDYQLYCERRKYPVTVPTRARFQIR